MKIALIGSPGSGKSTLAISLHSMLKIPLYHLDQYFWKPGWQRPDREEFKKIHHAICDGRYGLPEEVPIASEDWLVEGMATRHYEYRLERADVIIFLDVPLWLCLYRIYKRALLAFGKVREASAQGCPDRFPNWEFLVYIWNFHKNYKPKLLSLLDNYKDKKKIFVVRNQKEIDDLLDKF